MALDPTKLIIPLDELPNTRHAHEFVGADHGDVPFSVILVHTRPGGGPDVHRHPYAEVFIVESGEATFTLGDHQVEVPAGNVVVGPPGVAHGFKNSGSDELRVTAIHGAPRFITEWLAAADIEWASPPRPQNQK
jgi:mannose-6-phosphate isomerase-like protein (cupin superfamily)